MATVKTIDTYAIYSFGKYDSDRKFFIKLKDRDGRYIGYLYYIPDTQPLPDNELRNEKIFIYKHASQAAVDVDILRNESPVSVVYYSPTRAWIATGNEPVGEAE